MQTTEAHRTCIPNSILTDRVDDAPNAKNIWTEAPQTVK